LVSVLTQVRFEEIKKINTDADFTADFQEAIRRHYPLSVEETGHLIEVEPDGVRRSNRRTLRYMNAKKTERVTLTADSVALETRNYDSRAEFYGRLKNVCVALQETLEPQLVMRLGVRYVDQIYGARFDARARYINPNFLSPFLNEHSDAIVLNTNKLVAQTNEGNIAARWGFLNPGDTHDAEVMPALDTECWFLDIDSATHHPEPVAFDPKAIHDGAIKLSGRAYALFRHIVTDELLVECGGDLK